MLVEGYTHIGGRTAETSGLANMLAAVGVESPHTGDAFSEAMVFGLGPGIGAAYWTFAYGTGSTLTIGTRGSGWAGYGADAILNACTRLGAPTEVLETSGAKTAERDLRKTIEAGRPALLQLDMASLPYKRMPRLLERYFPHSVVVCGTDNSGAWLIDDCAPTPLPINAARLAHARASISNLKHRMVLITKGRPVSRGELSDAVRTAIRATATELLQPNMTNFGLPALEKWGRLVADPTHPHGWKPLFGTDHGLADALVWTYRWIETLGTGGGGYRSIYAAFLDEAAHVTGREELGRMAPLYRDLAGMWSALAEAATPETVPVLAETRGVLAEMNRAFVTRGTDAADELDTLSERLAGLEAKIADWWFRDGEALELLEGLSNRLLAIHARETVCARMLLTAIG